MPGMHILMWLLAKFEVSWLQSEAPKFSNLQWNFNTKSVMFLIALVSYLCDFEMEKKVMIHILFVSKYFNT